MKFVLLLLASSLVLGCIGRSTPDVLSDAEVSEIATSFRNSSFAASYEVRTYDSEFIEFEIAKRGVEMLLTIADGDDKIYVQIDLDRPDADPFACGVRETASGETICLVQDDQSWMIVLPAIVPVAGFLDVPQWSSVDRRIKPAGGREIAGVEADCYLLTDNEFSMDICLGPTGEALQQSSSLDEELVAGFTASSLEDDITVASTEIPHRVVFESELSTDECLYFFGAPCS